MGRKTMTDHKTAVGIARELGYKTIRKNSNEILRDAQGRTLVIAQTPSDHRAGGSVMKTLAMLQGCTIHGLQEVIAKRREECRQRRLQASAEPVLPVEPVVLLPVTLPEPEPAPLYSAEDERLLVKWTAQENRNLRKKEAKVAEKKRQRALLGDVFFRVTKMGHRILKDALAGKYKEYTDGFHASAQLTVLCMHRALREQGFKPRILVGEYTDGEGAVQGFNFIIEVRGFYIDALFATITEVPNWAVGESFMCECHEELYLTHGDVTVGLSLEPEAKAASV